MRTAEQWAQIEGGLDPNWSEAQVTFAPEGSVAEAAAVLGPLQPGMIGDELLLHIGRSEGGVERARNIFRRLDSRRIWGTLGLVGVITDVAPIAPDVPEAVAGGLAEAWDAALAKLPPDWSDALVRARARLERPRSASGTARRAAQPVARPGGDRAPLPRVG